MIHVITGYMGGGKSLYAVRYIYKNRKKYNTILTNTPLFFCPEKVKMITTDILDAIHYSSPPILVFLDEAHLLVDSRRSMSKANISWTHLLTLLRKMKTDMILTTQSLMQIDSRFRSLLRTFRVAKGLRYLDTNEGPQPFFIYEQYKILMDPFDGSYIRIWIKTEYLWWENAKKYFPLYDTNYIPEPTTESSHRISPEFLVGEYDSVKRIIKKMRLMGVEAHVRNYKTILRQLGLELAVHKDSRGNRTYNIYAARHEG